jgi:hypothetical protein
MLDDDASPIDRLRQPEYTGENRCTPCTIVNLVIAGLLAGAVAIVSLPLAGVIVVLSGLAIYFRGYLIPGTPTLTKRYLPEQVLALFDKDPGVESDVSASQVQQDQPDLEVFERIENERKNSVEPAQFLREADAVELCAGGDEFCLTDEFRNAIRDYHETVREDDQRRAALMDVFDVDSTDLEPREREYPAFKIDIRVRKWPSEAALTADLAADRALRDASERWDSVPVDQRAEILESLRGFLSTCPACGGPLEFDETVVESCCGTHQVKTFACQDCEERLLEFDHERVGEEATMKGVTP